MPGLVQVWTQNQSLHLQTHPQNSIFQILERRLGLVCAGYQATGRRCQTDSTNALSYADTLGKSVRVRFVWCGEMVLDELCHAAIFVSVRSHRIKSAHIRDRDNVPSVLKRKRRGCIRCRYVVNHIPKLTEYCLRNIRDNVTWNAASYCFGEGGHELGCHVTTGVPEAVKYLTMCPILAGFWSHPTQLVSLIRCAGVCLAREMLT